MSGKRGIRLLELPIYAGTVVGLAYMIYVVIYLGPLILYPSQADYAPAELVLNRFDPYCGWRHDMAVSPTGKQLVAAGPGRIYWIAHWDDKGHTRIDRHELDIADRVYAAAYSGDGTKVGFFIEERGKQPRTTRIEFYDPRRRQLVSKWATGPDHWIFNLLISPDGSLLLTESTDGLEIRKTASGEILRTLKIPEGRGWRDLTSSGRLMIVHCDDDYKEFTIYEDEEPYGNPKLISSIQAPAGTQLTHALFSPDGGLLAVRAHPALGVNVYRVSDGQLLAKLERPYHAVRYTFSSRGTFLAISYSDDRVVLWRIDPAQELCTLRGLPFYPIRFLAFGPDDKTLITRDAKATVVWDISRYVE
jgi:WD40 repeat protein